MPPHRALAGCFSARHSGQSSLPQNCQGRPVEIANHPYYQSSYRVASFAPRSGGQSQHRQLGNPDQIRFQRTIASHVNDQSWAQPLPSSLSHVSKAASTCMTIHSGRNPHLLPSTLSIFYRCLGTWRTPSQTPKARTPRWPG